MKLDVEKLRSSIGEVVSSVTLDVLFYSVEIKGALGSVLVSFTNGRQFTMSCAGDGGVFVARSYGTKGSPPGFVTERRTVEGLVGELHAVSSESNTLQLVISEHKVVLVNQDDELLMTVDGELLPLRLFKR